MRFGEHSHDVGDCDQGENHSGDYLRTVSLHFNVKYLPAMLHTNFVRGLILLALAGGLLAQGPFDVVIGGARVMDPESGLDGVRNVGVAGGKIQAISETPLTGRTVIDEAGCCVTTILPTCLACCI